MGFLLFLIAYFLFFPLSIINFVLVSKAGYFKETAINIDKLANREFRTLWNTVLRKENGYPFGAENETISSALGKNQLKGTLTKTGKFLVWVLDLLEKDHCILAITNDNHYTMKTKLSEPTPKWNVKLWQIGTFLYALAVFINENTDAISKLGFDNQLEQAIKTFGLFGYFLFTFFNFNKTNPKKNYPHEIPSRTN